MKILGIGKHNGREVIVGRGTYEEVKSLNTKKDYQKLITSYKILQARKNNKRKKASSFLPRKNSLKILYKPAIIALIDI